MTLKKTPWMIGGGAVHEPALGRTLAYVAANSSQGVLEPGHLKVTAQSTPNGTLQVAGGAAVITGKYTNQTTQSYVARNEGVESIAIPATAGSSRTDLIILRIDDPEYSGSVPADPVTHPYAALERVANVGTGATTASVPYPHIVLARVTIPANISAITNSMVTDLRKVAVPRTQRYLRVGRGGATAEVLNATGAAGEQFPPNLSRNLEIPSWATRMRISVDWGSLASPGSNNSNFFAEFWPRIGSTDFKEAKGVYDRPATADSMRFSVVGGSDIAVPVAMRGTTQSVTMRATLTGAPGNAASRPFVDASATVRLDVEFYEDAASV